jgi:hypothetical protein
VEILCEKPSSSKVNDDTGIAIAVAVFTLSGCSRPADEPVVIPEMSLVDDLSTNQAF